MNNVASFFRVKLWEIGMLFDFVDMLSFNCIKWHELYLCIWYKNVDYS